MSREIIKEFNILILALTLEFVLLFSFFSSQYSNYDKNLFIVKVNNQEVSCYYSEKYSDSFLIHTGADSMNSVSEKVNRIDLNSTMNLDVEEYEVYYQNGTRKSDNTGWYQDVNLTYKKIDSSQKRLVIKRMNKILYDGDYISDISQYVNAKGRYYLHIYNTRKDTLLASVTTHISFNMIVGGGNNGEE